MESLIRALTALVRRDARAPEKPRKLAVDLGDAPACVRALADALASSVYAVDLGAYSLHASTGPIVDLSTSFEMAVEAGFEDLDGHLDSAAPGGKRFDVTKSLELGPDAGGMSTLGVAWADGAVHVVVVEMEDPTPANLLRFASTPDAFFALLDRINRTQQGKDLEALRAQLGLAVAPAAPATPPSALRLREGMTLPHPFAEAQAQFATLKVLQATPTAAGRVTVVRRFLAGNPYTAAQLAVRTGGAGTVIDWPETVDINAVCAVPGQERVLLCTKAPAGPLVEVDLGSGTRRELLPKVAMGCGFADAVHLVTLADGQLRVHRWSEGELAEPLVTMACDANNVFVGHGHVFAKTKDYQNPSFRIFRWDGGQLIDAGVHPVQANVHMLHAAVELGGEKLVGSVDFAGKVAWFAFDPAACQGH